MCFWTFRFKTCGHFCCAASSLPLNMLFLSIISLVCLASVCSSVFSAFCPIRHKHNVVIYSNRWSIVSGSWEGQYNPTWRIISYSVTSNSLQTLLNHSYKQAWGNNIFFAHAQSHGSLGWTEWHIFLSNFLSLWAVTFSIPSIKLYCSCHVRPPLEIRSLCGSEVWHCFDTLESRNLKRMRVIAHPKFTLGVKADVAIEPRFLCLGFAFALCFLLMYSCRRHS